MIITQKKLSELHKPAINIRRHSEKQLAEYIRSVEMFGQVKPLVVAEDGEILAGNGLYEALLRMGWEICDCYVMAGLTDAQKKKLMMADNKVYELGFTDVDAIEELVKGLDGDTDVPGWDSDLLKLFTSTEDDADGMIDSYGVFSPEEISAVENHRVEEHIPYAETPSYSLVDTPKAAPAATAPAQGVSVVQERLIPSGPQNAAQANESAPQRKYIRCPKCGEMIRVD